MSDIQFTDRYQAAGVPYPDSQTVCRGHCEGMGCYPQFVDVGGNWTIRPVEEATDKERAAWFAEHEKVHRLGHRLKMVRYCDFLPWHRRIAILWERCDGWHFIKCPDCGGTGKRR